MTTSKSVVDGDPESEGIWDNGAGRNWSVTVVFTILATVLASQVNACVKIHQNVHFKHMKFILHKLLYLTKDENKKLISF